MDLRWYQELDQDNNISNIVALCVVSVSVIVLLCGYMKSSVLD